MEVRLVSVDYYVRVPVVEVDVCYSNFGGSGIKSVPVIRVFGSTPAGQKTCVHIHKVFPYFFVNYAEGLPLDYDSVNSYAHKLAVSIERAVDVSLGYKGQHVSTSSNLQCNLLGNAGEIYKITVVRGKPFYGYYPNEQIFLKIFLYNPQMMTKIANLLRSGAIMETKFQVHEAHIPFVLQFFIDYNLYGMGFLNLSSFKFRHPVPKTFKLLQWNNQIQYETLNPLPSRIAHSINAHTIWTESTISKSDIVHTLPRTTTCQLEIDTEADCILKRRCVDNSGDILNINDLTSDTPLSCINTETKLVRSLAALWKANTISKSSDMSCRRKSKEESKGVYLPKSLKHIHLTEQLYLLKLNGTAG